MCYARNRHLFDQIVIYEDLLENPQSETGKLFRTMDVPLKHITNCLTAMKKDSQGKFFGHTDGRKSQIFTPSQWAKIDNVFKQLKVPVSYNMTLNEFRALVQNF